MYWTVFESTAGMYRDFCLNNQRPLLYWFKKKKKKSLTLFIGLWWYLYVFYWTICSYYFSVTLEISAYFSQYLCVQRNPLCVILVQSCSWANASDHCVAQTIMTIWRSGGSELLTRCVLLLSRGRLPSEWPRAFGGAGGIGKEKAEAPGDARGSLVLLSVWAWLAVVGNLKQTEKSKKKRRVVVYCTLLVLMTGTCGRASSAATEMQQAL